MVEITKLSLLASAIAARSQGPTNVAHCPLTPAALQLPSGQTTLVAPTFAPDFVALGVGVQNYTCSSSSNFTSSGAVAELFDISCYVDTPIFSSLSPATFAFWSALPSLDTFNTTSLISLFNNPLYLGGNPNPVVDGQHYFVPNPVTGAGISPAFDFSSGRFNGFAGQDGGEGKKATVVAGGAVNLKSPDDPTVDVDWLRLSALQFPGQGELAQTVFRVETAGGQPPASCNETGSTISVKYVAKYYFYNSTLPSS